MCIDLETHRKENIFMKRYGYHRTSTREQHLDRGIAEITAYCEQCKSQALFSLVIIIIETI